MYFETLSFLLADFKHLEGACNDGEKSSFSQKLYKLRTLKIRYFSEKNVSEYIHIYILSLRTGLDHPMLVFESFPFQKSSFLTAEFVFPRNIRVEIRIQLKIFRTQWDSLHTSFLVLESTNYI